MKLNEIKIRWLIYFQKVELIDKKSQMIPMWIIKNWIWWRWIERRSERWWRYNWKMKRKRRKEKKKKRRVRERKEKKERSWREERRRKWKKKKRLPCKKEMKEEVEVEVEVERKKSKWKKKNRKSKREHVQSFTHGFIPFFPKKKKGETNTSLPAMEWF